MANKRPLISFGNWFSSLLYRQSHRSHWIFDSDVRILTRFDHTDLECTALRRSCVCVCVCGRYWRLSRPESLPDHRPLSFSRRYKCGVCASHNLTTCAGHVVPTFSALTLTLSNTSAHTCIHKHTLTAQAAKAQMYICALAETHKHLKMPNRWRCNLSPLLKWEPRAGFGLRKVSPSTHYVGWPTLPRGGGERGAALCSSAL